MNRIWLFRASALLALAVPVPASSAVSPLMVGVGAHGYDWLVGAWTCKNDVPSTMAGPAVTTLTVARSANGSLSIRSDGAGFDAVGFVAYAAKSKTWWNPTALADGDSSNESSRQTGKKTLWTGSFFDAERGKTIPIRDTYTVSGEMSFGDLSEAQVGGAWKTQANTTCTKS